MPPYYPTNPVDPFHIFMLGISIGAAIPILILVFRELTRR